MIYTVTFNPSIDYIVSMDNFSLGKTNRTTAEKMFPGGKGINVSTVLTNLGVANIALGFLAGFTGEKIKRLTIQRGILCDFINPVKVLFWLPKKECILRQMSHRELLSMLLVPAIP